MKIKCLLLLATAALASAATPRDTLSATDNQAIIRAVSAVYDEMVVAAESLDADALFRHVAEMDQGAVVTNGRLFLTRREALETIRTSFLGIKSVTYDIASRRCTVLSPASVLLVAELTTHIATDDGRTFARSSVQSIVFVFRDNNWKVLHSHQSNVRTS